ncbi:hypothetical protein BS78_09G138700 [Paspalum vaginatum]|nr:hypothetical protein BS78_09G138700 [Paspalum vaginatum]
MCLAVRSLALCGWPSQRRCSQTATSHGPHELAMSSVRSADERGGRRGADGNAVVGRAVAGAVPEKKKSLYTHSQLCVVAWLRSLGFTVPRAARTPPSGSPRSRSGMTPQPRRRPPHQIRD